MLTKTKKCTNAALAPTIKNHSACWDVEAGDFVVDFVIATLFINLFFATDGFIN
ncbi:hypothetical protein CZ794_10310 [Psychrobacter sp. JB385]|nr:hypothetical protein CZ794_10310 [Psychrobacter sp. JB385]